MKKILAILSLISFAALMAPQANAQTYGYQTLFTAGTIASGTSITNATANACTAVADVRKQSTVAFRLTVRADAADTSDCTMHFKRSADGVTYDTASFVIGIPMTGVTSKTIHTNVNTYGCGYIKLVAVSNAAASAIITNCTVGYAVKPNAP